ncbi:MAG: RNA 2',3'-cyclic phosphodiesterase [Candidatus Acidulodesulfobacterium ferriphilum]|jgi:2''-5'' RNA ligase|uniref:RNA 2',3'-cyclic phosphodiesterase n=1 Tax=Candidatus Acidulodesulfobacterium ferriphilum TaxID=2597223 RepID=A0A519BDI6_9DELT|nr:MAG: RNA 2',3'-cyclic phosphodiesterase [Candidatus Acidulodesulfobacterium ferriphilum]
MEKPETKRLFIAVDLPSAIKKRVTQFVKSARLADTKYFRPVPQKNLHITILFLGNIELNQEAVIKKLLSEIEIKNFDISVGNNLFFSLGNSSGIVYLKIKKGARELKLIYENLLKGVLNSGINIKIDKRPFMPHITLARIKDGSNNKNKNDILNLLKPFNPNNAPLSPDGLKFREFNCKKIILKQSITEDGSPVYKNIYHSHPFMQITGDR